MIFLLYSSIEKSQMNFKKYSSMELGQLKCKKLVEFATWECKHANVKGPNS